MDNFINSDSLLQALFLQPLTKAEEAKFIDQLLAGDEAARDQLIEHNLRLVAHLVKKFEKKQAN